MPGGYNSPRGRAVGQLHLPGTLTKLAAALFSFVFSPCVFQELFVECGSMCFFRVFGSVLFASGAQHPLLCMYAYLDGVLVYWPPRDITAAVGRRKKRINRVTERRVERT